MNSNNRPPFKRGLYTLVLALIAALLLAPLVVWADTTTDADTLRKEVIDLITKHHVSGVHRSTLTMDDPASIVASLDDPYSELFNPQQWKDFMNMLENNYVGIGIRVGMDEHGFYINEVFADTPALDAGLQAGDYIVAVDGASAAGKSTDKLVTEITGEEGTTVTVTIERGSEQFDVTIARKEIHLPALTSHLIPNRTGYIRITSFSSDVDELFTAHMDQMSKKGMSSLIIDMRNNPGGLLDSAGNIAKRFIKDGQLIYSRDRAGKETPYPVKGENVVTLPLTVLVNGSSASASEVLAGALQDYELATLIGSQTYGKGSVQSMFQLSGGSVLKLTVQEYLTPLKRPVNHVGLTPDVEVLGHTAQLITALQRAGDIDIRLELGQRSLTINGLDLNESFEVRRDSGKTYVPARVLAAIVDGAIEWDAHSRSVVIAGGDGVKASFPMGTDGVYITSGVSFLELDHFGRQFPLFGWHDGDGGLVLAEAAGR